MYINFQITCRSCAQAFGLESEHFSKKQSLLCPNCGQPFPDEELRQLEAVMRTLRSISEVCAASSTENGFDVKISGAGNAEAELPF